MKGSKQTPMKISYQRTGGFAGMVMSFDLDIADLPSEEADELANLVASAKFFELPVKISTDASIPDQFQYVVTVETEGKQHSVEVGDASMPENLWPLLEKLRVLSRSTRNQ